MASRSTNHPGPVHEIRFGRIRAAIWEHASEHGSQYSVTVGKRYKSGEEWKDSNSYYRDELPVVAKVLDLCHTWIFQTSANSSARNNRRSEYD